MTAEQCVEASAGGGRARHDRHAAQRGGLEELLDVGLDQVEPLVVDQVALGQRDDAIRDPQQVEDGDVLARLGHHAFVGGDHQQGDVDAADAGEHVVDEALVAGHVDDRHLDAVRQSQPGEAEIDGHAALLFFLEAVGVDAGQGPDERRLAVVDVAGGADDSHQVVRRSGRVSALARRRRAQRRLARAGWRAGRAARDRRSMRPITGGSARTQRGRQAIGRRACRSATAQLGCVWPGSEPPPIAERVATGVAAQRARPALAPAPRARSAAAEIIRQTGTSRSASPRR